MNELALFAGAGGGILGGSLLGWRTVCAVERNPYAASVLAQRQNDGVLETFPIWDDVCTFDGRPWRGIVDVVSGGFPCQDISSAGTGSGITGERSGLWSEMARIIGEVRPRFVFVENSPMLTSRGLDTVLADLASMGFDAEWGVISAADCGAHHKRDRMWIVADSASKRQQGQRQHVDPRHFAQDRERQTGDAVDVCEFGEWPVEPAVGRVVDGMAARMDRLTALGNGQVPRVAAAAFATLQRRLLGGRING